MPNGQESDAGATEPAGQAASGADTGPAVAAGGSPAWLSSPNPLVRWGGRAWLLLGLLLVGWLLWEVAAVTRLVIVPLVIALFPAGIFMPVVDWLEDRGWPRGLAALLSTTALFVFIAALLALFGWQISQQLSGITEQVADSWERLRTTLGDPSWLPQSLTAADVAESAASGAGSSSEAGADGSGGGGLASVVVLGRSVFELGAQFFLGIVAMFFYLRDGTAIGAFLANLFPATHQEDAREIGKRTWVSVTRYIRGQSIVALVDGVLFALGLLVLGVPLAWVLGGVVALGAFVPVVGSIVAGAIGVGVALVTNGLTTGLLTLALIVGVQQLEGNVLAPYVLGRELEVHPLVVLVAVTLGAALMGPFGALIGVPLAASLHQAGKYVRSELA
jgi:predicted PurR-regulated permease PerM